MPDITATRVKGIDVSHHVPIEDFNQLARVSDVRFVGVKATEGNTFVDPKFSYHQIGLRSLPPGLAMDLVIYYHFARSGDPDKQAVRLMNTVGELKPNERFCLDLEGSLPAEPAKVIEWIEAFYRPILDAYPFMAKQFLYTSARVWKSFNNPEWNPSFVDNIALWAPRYNNSGWEPVLPAPWKTIGWTIWQFSDGETPPSTVAGVGPCDTNLWNGDIEHLKQWLTPFDLLSSIYRLLPDLSEAQLTSLQKRISDFLPPAGGENSFSAPVLPESPFKG